MREFDTAEDVRFLFREQPELQIIAEDMFHRGTAPPTYVELWKAAWTEFEKSIGK